jgi:hypothetical protein
VHGAAPRVVLLDGAAVPGTAGRFLLPNAGIGFRVELEV